MKAEAFRNLSIQPIPTKHKYRVTSYKATKRSGSLPIKTDHIGMQTLRPQNNVPELRSIYR